MWCFQCIQKDACCREYLQHSESSANVLKLCCILESWFLYLFHLSVCLSFCVCAHISFYTFLYVKTVTLYLGGEGNFFFTYINKFFCNDQISIITMDIWGYINVWLFFFLYRSFVRSAFTKIPEGSFLLTPSLQLLWEIFIWYNFCYEMYMYL